MAIGNFTFMNVVIETERLLLRTFTKDDATLIYELNGDPDVTRYTHDPVKDLAHAKEILEKNDYSAICTLQSWQVGGAYKTNTGVPRLVWIKISSRIK